MRRANREGEPLEAQLVDWLRTFEPDDELRERVLAAIRDATHDEDTDGTRRRDLTVQLERLQDLYLGPPTDPQLEQAAALLADFGRFWEIEPAPAERRKLIAQLFERIWEHGGAIVAVRPHAAFAPYFEAAPRTETAPQRVRCRKRERRGSVPDFAHP